MLNNQSYYWGTIRRLIVGFGSIFSDIHIVRVDSKNTSITKTIKVPLTYGPKEKWLYRTKQDPMPGVDDSVEIILPRISYEVIGFQYDTNRKLTSTGRTVKALMSGSTPIKTQFNPVPYNLSIELNVMTKTLNDGFMIIEQILPFFTPDYTITVNDILDMGITKEIPVVLNGIVSEDSWTGDFRERRNLTWTLSFTMKGYLYPPEQMTKVVLTTQTNYDVEDPTGGSEVGLPTTLSTPYPDGATPETITDVTVTQIPKSVRIFVTPTSATLSSTQSQTFTINIINTTNVSYTVTGVSSVDTAVAHFDTFVYTAGTRTETETVVVSITSVADPTRTAIIVLTLNP